MRVAFAGLRHGHIFALYDMVQKHPMYQITGAFEENEEARKAAEEKGVCCRYASYAELLADPDVDAVAMGGCYGDRGQMAVQALLAGKHVMADKPLCTSLSQLDEIEAALDENNVGRFVDMMKKKQDKTQFIVITHRRGTMEAADTVFGVTMQEKGISKILGISLKESIE